MHHNTACFVRWVCLQKGNVLFGSHYKQLCHIRAVEYPAFVSCLTVCKVPSYCNDINLTFAACVLCARLYAGKFYMAYCISFSRQPSEVGFTALLTR